MAQCRQKRDYDSRVPIREMKFDVDDVVYFLNSTTVVGQSKKLLPMWKGPLIVIEVISTFLYRLAGRNREYVKHHDKLRLCEDRDIPLRVRRKRNMVVTDGVQNTSTANIANDDNLFAGVEQLFQPVQSTVEQEISLVQPRITRCGRTVNRPFRYSD